MDRNPRHLAALVGAAPLAAGCASAPTAADLNMKPATPTTAGATQAQRPVVAAFDKRDFAPVFNIVTP